MEEAYAAILDLQIESDKEFQATGSDDKLSFFDPIVKTLKTKPTMQRLRRAYPFLTHTRQTFVGAADRA